MIGEQTLNVEQGMNRDTVEVAHDQHGGRRVGSFLRHRFFEVWLKRDREERVVQALKSGFHPVVMGPNVSATEHEKQSDQQGQPTALGKFRRNGYEQNNSREQQSETIDAELAQPRALGAPHLPPMTTHAELRESECQKHVNTIHDHEEPHCAVAVY